MTFRSTSTTSSSERLHRGRRLRPSHRGQCRGHCTADDSLPPIPGHSGDVLNSTGVYKPNPDPWHAYVETDPLGDAHVPGVPTYSVSKITEEAVACACARQMSIPTIICRMNSAYGVTGTGGLPGHLFDRIRAGEQVVLRSDPNPYSPINDRDIFEQTEALLEMALPSCPIVNWGGDEPVPTQEWCSYFGELLGVTPDVSVIELPNTQPGVVADSTKRMAFTGPCRVGWREGMKGAR